jgi:hypothetical protein
VASHVGAQQVSRASESTRPAGPIGDVALGARSTLFGRVVDEQGRGLANVRVTLVHDQAQVAVSETDTQGAFQFTAMRGGVYQVDVLRQRTTYRVWSEGTAPLASDAFVQIRYVPESAPTIYRGQAPLLGAGLTTSVVVGTVVATAVTATVVTSGNHNDRSPSS